MVGSLRLYVAPRPIAALPQKSDHACIPHLATENEEREHKPRCQWLTCRGGWVFSLLPGVLLTAASTCPLFFARAQRSRSNNAIISTLNSRNFKKVHGSQQSSAEVAAAAAVDGAVLKQRSRQRFVANQKELYQSVELLRNCDCSSCGDISCEKGRTQLDTELVLSSESGIGTSHVAKLQQVSSLASWLYTRPGGPIYLSSLSSGYCAGRSVSFDVTKVQVWLCLITLVIKTLHLSFVGIAAATHCCLPH